MDPVFFPLGSDAILTPFDDGNPADERTKGTKEGRLGCQH